MWKLQIKKQSLYTWLHIDSTLGEFILSKFEFSADGTKFQIYEANGAKRRIYDISEIEVFDIGGTAETFTSTTDLSLRLEELKYPAFNLGGIFTFAPSNYDLSEFKNESTDPFAKQSEVTSGVPLTKKTVSLIDIEYPDADGFLTYLNALSPNLTIAENEIVTYEVTETKQVFRLLVNNITIGSGQTALTSSSLVIEKDIDWQMFKGDLVEHQATGAAISSYGAAAPTTVGTGTNTVADFSAAYANSPAQTWNRRVSSSATTAGSSAEFYDNARIFVSNSLGFMADFKFAIPTVSANSRFFVGLHGSNAAAGNVDPSTFTDMIGIAFDSADSVVNIMSNDNAGTATKVSTGFNPDKTSVIGATLRGRDFKVKIFNLFGSTSVYVSVHNLRTNTFYNKKITTNLPAVTTGLSYRLWANNGTDANLVNMVWSNFKIQRQS